MNDRYICCLCGKECEGYGNNPYPLHKIYGAADICCDECNRAVVLPARMESLVHRFESLNKELRNGK